MTKDFITVEQLTTFAGLITAVVLVTQFIKWMLSAINVEVRNTIIYKIIVWIVSIALLFLFNPQYVESIQTIVLGIINSMFLTLSAMGMYDSIDGQNDVVGINVSGDGYMPLEEYLEREEDKID